MPKFVADLTTGAFEDKLLLVGTAADKELGRALLRISQDAIQQMKHEAPKGRTGALQAGIRLVSAQGRRATVGNFSVFTSGRDFFITAEAKDPLGFDYVNVTRFGHRQFYIHPKPPNKFLKLPPGPGPIYRRFVKGQRNRDWAGVAQTRAVVQSRQEGVSISKKLGLIANG